ncbi:type II toxin-antitoxin system VapC family toxin [Candidatus Thiodictyon syntrophicum]|uniref:Ribonuclease VapC n=1 Tax=Candidatus Thiodictyon syntrophicum TaxID=1166950 RepID=A0A2K8UE81_9GAMM|nr:hypothetical protein THSYN_24670 [Candidatus Thiodictyon syntrophicum]
MSYLLDTNACIEVLRGRNATLKARLAATRFEELSLCSIVWAELYCGVRLAVDPSRELVRVHTAFGNWPRLPFDDPAAECYGEIRAHLRRAGQLIGANDLLIAAIAHANGRILVTHNTSEFGRVPGLVIEDWQA